MTAKRQSVHSAHSADSELLASRPQSPPSVELELLQRLLFHQLKFALWPRGHATAMSSAAGAFVQCLPFPISFD